MEEWLMEKRFTTNGYYIYDHFKGNEWLVNEVEAEEIVEIMNNLDMKTRERSKALSKLQKENEQLKQLLDEAEDIIMCQCTPHYQRQWENIKKNLKR